MNFDFLKGLRGLGGIYEDCTNAEKLAVSMPVQSLFTSRKSAELLAKFIYMAAHKEEIEGLTFMDILSDETVRKYVNNRTVMNAFHSIRKTGNRAVHGESSETPEAAIDVLQDLHYVVGETACMLGLINSYPEFERDIQEYSDVIKANIEEDINKRVLQMFQAYVERYDAEQERANYYSPSDEEFYEYLIEGNVDMHEYLEFHRKPKHIAITEFLQDYLLFLETLSVQRAPFLSEELELNYPVIISLRIQLNGKTVYSTDSEKKRIDLINAVRTELPKADSFIIDCRCKGNLRSIYYDDENDTEGKLHKDRIWDGSGMLNKLESFKHRELFSYRKIQYFPDSGNVVASAIVNGKTKEISDLFSDKIMARPNHLLQCDGYRIYVVGDKPIIECPVLFEEIKDLIRDNTSEYDWTYCEETWNPNDDNYEEGCILPFVQLKVYSVGEIEAFLNKLNRCLKPWAEEYKFWIEEPNFDDPLYGTDENILYDIDDLSLATVVLRDGELHLAGSLIEYNKMGFDTVNTLDPKGFDINEGFDLTNEEVLELEALIDNLIKTK